MAGADRTARWRKARREAGQPTQSPDARTGNRHRKAGLAPFVGVDGEGCGTDALGRQYYMLLRAGERELFTGEPLTTIQCLDFLCDCPTSRDACLVGFAFGYDTTMILRDLSDDRRADVLAPKPSGDLNRFTWYRGFGICYLPRNFLRVCRTREIRDADGNMKTVAIKGSSRTVYETFGFFQSTFAKALVDGNIGLDYLEEIKRFKDARAGFNEIDAGVRRYCGLECDFLAQLMEQLRTNCFAANIVPRTWNGAGKLAAALHKRENTPRRVDLTIPAEVEALGRAAYYGGRFEVTRIGRNDGPIYGYDINSAYPAAMDKLPCLHHGKWEAQTGAQLKAAPADAIYVSECRFDHSRHADLFPGQPLALCGLPIRRKEGHIFWPQQGNGVYWSIEIKAAEKLGARIYHKGGYIYRRQCSCHQFNWLEPLYNHRKSLGKSGVGYPIKFAINSLYGKLAQRVGNPVWGNFIWAGLITATTRAALMDAAAQNPTSVLMIATDGIYTTAPLALPVGGNLGQWEEKISPYIFIVQPGLYWGATKKPKSRGIPAKFFETRTTQFETAWQAFKMLDRNGFGAEFPIVSLSDYTMFIGLKLAQARGKPETAGKWVSCERKISFDPYRKRDGYAWNGDYIITRPHAGSKSLTSVIHIAEQLELWDNAKLELDDQPDYVDLSAPWSD